MALETLSLPDRHVDCVDPIANSGHGSGNYQLHALRCRCLQNGSDYHDPASPLDTTFPPITISSQECHDCAYETTDVIDSGDDAFELGAWIVEIGAKRAQANYSAEDTLVVAEKLVACESVFSWTVKLPRHTRHVRIRLSKIKITQVGATVTHLI